MAAGIDTHDLCKGSEALTHGIRVSVTPAYEPSHSMPDAQRFAFSYRIRIANESERRVHLLRRRWVVIDSTGEAEVIEGEGVVGQQPVIEPGDAYEYSSWCPLPTRWGTMEGEFAFDAEPGDAISVAVARFFLIADDAEPAADPA